MSPEFKIGEVNNYFSQDDANSIFKIDADSNVSEDKKDQKRVEIIIENIEKKIKDKTNQREQLLDQLQLIDIQIDQYDRLIMEVDAKVQPFLDLINTQINAVKAAYDARISAGCANSLKWVAIAWETRGYGSNKQQFVTYECQRNALQTITRQERIDGSIEIIRTGVTDPATIVTGYYAYKFYRKPLNRDYGANLVDVFTGSISVGSTILQVEQSEFDATAGDDGLEFQIGDEITDSIESPTLFALGSLPAIVGVGSTTTFSGITTTIQGSISVGSTILSLVGFGTVDTGNVLVRLNTVTSEFSSTAADFGAKVGSGIGKTGILPIDTKVIAIGTGTTTYEYYDPTFNSGIGTITSETANVMTLVLSSAAIGSTSLGQFNVGIVSFTPSLILSNAATGTGSGVQFSVIRPANDPDKDFDFQKNPKDPVTIGLITESNLGLGHTAIVVNNAEPTRTIGWHQVRNYSFRQSNGEIREYDPEPPQGGGRAVYHSGNQEWPVLKRTKTTGIGETYTYAFEGQRVILKSTGSNSVIITDPDTDDGVGVGLGNNLSVVSVSPGITGNCTTLANDITAAEAALVTITNENLPQANRFAAQARALRELRDDMELDAYGLLQASAATRKEIDRLTVLLNEIKAEELDSYG
tara:strand:- start:294 stop:2216 length:1923 start_codon:yes stop_codon:yes gene_type:complete